jgi:hypothetical protein
VTLSRPLSGRAVSIRADVVVKVQEPEGSRRERLRTLAGGEVGRATGLFVVPDIVAFDDARGELSFRRLQLMSFRQALSQTGRSMELADRAGRALAAIHGGMQSGAKASGSVARLVPLHGDFGMRNVFWLADSQALAIIDWSNADWTGVDADVGVPEIDLAVFLISLFHRRIFGPWPIAQRHQVARRFLSAYSTAAPYGLDVEVLRSVVAGMSPAFIRMNRRRKGSLHALGCRHALIDLKFFLRRLSNPG